MFSDWTLWSLRQDCCRLGLRLDLISKVLFQARAVLFHALREDLTVFQLLYLKKEENLAFKKKED